MILLVSIGKIPSIYSHIKSREECLYGVFAIERYETQKKLKIDLILNLHFFQYKEHN